LQFVTKSAKLSMKSNMKLSQVNSVIFTLVQKQQFSEQSDTYFYSTIKHGIWGEGGISFNSKKILTLQDKSFQNYGWSKPRNSCASLLTRLEILPLPCKHVFINKLQCK
jgi:hypothetical protein